MSDHGELLLVADAESGARHSFEEHVLSLFSPEAYLAAFAEAGCPVEFQRPPWPGPGLYVGVRS